SLLQDAHPAAVSGPSFTPVTVVAIASLASEPAAASDQEAGTQPLDPLGDMAGIPVAGGGWGVGGRESLVSAGGGGVCGCGVKGLKAEDGDRVGGPAVKGGAGAFQGTGLQPGDVPAERLATSPSWSGQVAKWVMRHKSLITKELVSCSRVTSPLRHRLGLPSP